MARRSGLSFSADAGRFGLLSADAPLLSPQLSKGEGRQPASRSLPSRLRVRHRQRAAPGGRPQAAKRMPFGDAEAPEEAPTWHETYLN